MSSHTLRVLTAFLPMLAAYGVVTDLGAEPAEAMASGGASIGRLVVRGHGYGHGHGMSQYGAQGSALRGRSYRQIVDFYYPGTSWSTLHGAIRVLITADTTTDLVVNPARGLTVRDRGDGAAYRLPVSGNVKRWRLDTADGATVVERLTDRWRRYSPGGRGQLVGDGEFFAAVPMTLWTPSGSRRYRGILRAASPSEGAVSRDTVNALPMDDYLQGVVPYEMPASWHPEAVKAQAIAARTYATWSRNQNRQRYYQICDSTSCQVYGGVDGEDARSSAAVVATTRQILTYQGEAAFTQFSASSGGWTSQGSVPYLPARRDPHDGWSGNSVHSWSQTIHAETLERRYPRVGSLRRIRVLDRTGDGDWGGRVNRLVLDGTRGDVTLSGDSFRGAVGLRSTWFTLN